MEQTPSWSLESHGSSHKLKKILTPRPRHHVISLLATSETQASLSKTKKKIAHQTYSKTFKYDNLMGRKIICVNLIFFDFEVLYSNWRARRVDLENWSPECQKCLGQFLKIIESPNLDVSAAVDFSQGLASKELKVSSKCAPMFEVLVAKKKFEKSSHLRILWDGCISAPCPVAILIATRQLLCRVAIRDAARHQNMPSCNFAELK